MRLYTICIKKQAVVTMCLDAEDSLSAELVMNGDIQRAIQLSRDLADSPRSDVQRLSDIHEIDQALDTWLGANLRVLESDGRALWAGDSGDLDVREASTDGAEQWHITRREAIFNGELEARKEGLVLFLVPVDEEGLPEYRETIRSPPSIVRPLRPSCPNSIVNSGSGLIDRGVHY